MIFTAVETALKRDSGLFTSNFGYLLHIHKHVGMFDIISLSPNDISSLNNYTRIATQKMKKAKRHP